MKDTQKLYHLSNFSLSNYFKIKGYKTENRLKKIECQKPERDRESAQFPFCLSQTAVLAILQASKDELMR